MHSITVPRASLSLMLNRFSIHNFHSFAQLCTTFMFIKCSAPPTHCIVIGPNRPNRIQKVLFLLILNLRALIDISICQTVNSICQNRIHFAATCLRLRRISFEFQIFYFIIAQCVRTLLCTAMLREHWMPRAVRKTKRRNDKRKIIDTLQPNRTQIVLAATMQACIRVHSTIDTE